MEASQSGIVPTWCRGLLARAFGRAPEIHVRVRYVGCPGKVDGIDIVINQADCLVTWINPVYIAVAR